MWHNLINCKIIYDRTGKLKAAKEKYDIPYPQDLKKAIIERQLNLMDHALPAYKGQIEKALRRKDFVSVNHRVTEFLASYFDLLFALNEKTHPGEKRLIELCKSSCPILPKDFEKNIKVLLSHLYLGDDNHIKVMDDLNRMIASVRQIL